MIENQNQCKCVHTSDFTEKDFEPFLPLRAEKLEKFPLEVHYLGYYLKWIPQETFYYAVENCNFRPRPFRTQGTFCKYHSIDDKIDDLHFYTTFIKFGIGRATYDSAQEVRNGDITRDEGISLVKRFDGEFPKQYIQDCCNYMNITMQEYYDAIEKFRSPHLWKKVNGEWELKSPIWNED